MNLYLFRHGPAVNIGEKGVTSDAERVLSDEGIKKTRAAAKGLACLCPEVDRIVSSPYPRAKQTADIAAEALGFGGKVETVEILSAGADPDDVIEWLQKQNQAGMMLVGHNPDFEMLASKLLCRKGQPDIEIKKASACQIALPHGAAPGQGTLRWLLQPKQLRMLGKRMD